MDKHLLDKLIGIRRQLHLHPELGFQEFNTSALVQQELSGMGIPFEMVAVTGVIGNITKGNGPEVILRADMDALPVREETGLAYSSTQEQVMHACGHDLHTTILLGAAALLKELPFEGTVKLLFQPSEEGTERSPEKGKSGGQIVAESGKLSNAKAALGLHVHPLLPVGLLGFKNGEALANVCSFTLRITGKGGHAGSLEHVIDPVLVAGQIIVAAQSIISHNATLQSAVLAFTHMETTAAASYNVIPQGTVLQGSLRAINIDTYNRLLEKFRLLLKGMEVAYECSIEMEQVAYYPSLLNDAGVHQKLGDVHASVFGKERVLEGTAHLVAEDFAFYSRMMPSQFYYLGAQEQGNDQYFLHHPKVTFNEACIPYGARFLAEGALALIKSF